jgi:hypothetical protein
MSYMSSLLRSVEISAEALRPQREAIFGRERVAIGDSQSPSELTVRRFRKDIEILWPGDLVWLPGGGNRTIRIGWNPTGDSTFGDGELDRSLASVSGLHQHTECILRPRGPERHLGIGAYVVYDALSLAGGEEPTPLLTRTYAPHDIGPLTLGNRVHATIPAVEADMQGALAILDPLVAAMQRR